MNGIMVRSVPFYTSSKYLIAQIFDRISSKRVELQANSQLVTKVSGKRGCCLKVLMNLKFNFPHSLSHTSQHQRTIERRWCTQWIRIVSEHKKNMAKGLYSIVNILSLTIASLDNLKGKNLIIGQPGAFTLSCSNHVPWVDEKSAAISLLISRVVQWLSQWIGKTSSKRSGHGIHSRWVGECPMACFTTFLAYSDILK